MANHDRDIEEIPLSIDVTLVERVLSSVRGLEPEVAASALLIAAAFCYGMGAGDSGGAGARLEGFMRTARGLQAHIEHGREVRAMSRAHAANNAAGES